MDFFLNVFTEFAEFSYKIFVITVKVLKPATSCVRDKDTTITPTSYCHELLTYEL